MGRYKEIVSYLQEGGEAACDLRLVPKGGEAGDAGSEGQRGEASVDNRLCGVDTKAEGGGRRGGVEEAQVADGGDPAGGALVGCGGGGVDGVERFE